jgi:hypothetical protein
MILESVLKEIKDKAIELAPEKYDYLLPHQPVFRKGFIDGSTDMYERMKAQINEILRTTGNAQDGLIKEIESKDEEIKRLRKGLENIRIEFAHSTVFNSDLITTTKALHGIDQIATKALNS